MFSFEPIWVCSSCRGPAHMRCIVERNRAVFSSPTTRALDRHLAERGGIDESEDDEDPSGLFFAPFSTTSGSSPRHKATPHPFTSNEPCDVCSMGEGRRVILPPNLLRSQGLKEERGELASSPSLSSTPSFSRRSILEALPSKLMKHSNPQDRWSLFSLDPNISHPITPLVVFINSKSGPQAGQMLKMQCLQLLSPLQVVELPKEKPEPALRFFSSIPGARILVIGGDGTVSWILSCLDALQKEREDLSHGSAFSSPWRSIPVAVFPFGTGNDLARCLGWGGGMWGFMREPLPSLLNAVLEAAPVPLDRWDVCIRQEETPKGSKGTSIAQLVSSSLTGAKRGKNSSSGSSSITSPAAALKTEPSRVMNNYLGIGIDAQVAVEFHRLRENFPSLFIDQLGNKALYTGVGSIDLLRQSCAGLGSKLTLTCDGFEIPLPSDAHGLIILSIGCHMGGVKLWDDGLPVPNELKSSTMAQVKSSFSDGVLEVVAIGGVIHMGRLAVGLASAQRLCQCRSLSLTTKEKIPMQVDGEPWVQPPGTIEVNLRGGRGGVVLKRVESGLLQISQAIQAALEKSTRAGVINDQQRHKLTAEIMRGLEG